MLNKKFLLLSFALCISGLSIASADTLSEVEFPKPPAYRVGISELPENQYVQAKQEKIKAEKILNQMNGKNDTAITDMTYADLSISRLSKEIAKELEYEEADMVADLSLLWQGAATQSDTINFALYKLANPDADKPDGKSIKKVLTTIASMSTLVGASMANPMLAGSSLIGGNILNIMSQDTKALNYKYTRVNDADMIILIRKIEDLQQNAINLYYDYMCAKKQLELANKLVDDRQRKFELAQKNNAARELVVITDAYYRTAIDKQRTAKSNFFSKRAALEQFVGNETFVQFEAELTAREKGEPSPSKAAQNKETEEEYNETIKTVEIYTKNLETDNAEEVKDENLQKLPELRPLDTKSENLTEDNEIIPPDIKVSAAASIEEDDEKPAKKQKVKKEKIKKEKPVKEKKEKNPTKGFIFLHGQDKNTINVNNNTQKQFQNTEFAPLDPIIPRTRVEENNQRYNFAPLDAIPVPSLDGRGYSIHNWGDTNL